MDTGHNKKEQDAIEHFTQAHLESTAHPTPAIYQNPARIFFIVVMAIFLSEALVMCILAVLPPFSTIAEALIDAIMLTVLLLPFLYHLIFVPLRSHINELRTMERKLNESVITDDLTGLLNRRGFFTISQKQCEIARRNNLNLSFLYIDLDGMKAINDEHGHKAGDEALVDVANILKDSFRSSDIISRIGGDEFTVAVIETPETNFEALTKRLNENLNNHNARSEASYKLSLSQGLAQYNHENPCSVDELISIADRVMYEKKREKLRYKKSS